MGKSPLPGVQVKLLTSSVNTFSTIDKICMKADDTETICLLYKDTSEELSLKPKCTCPFFFPRCKL